MSTWTQLEPPNRLRLEYRHAMGVAILLPSVSQFLIWCHEARAILFCFVADGVNDPGGKKDVFSAILDKTSDNGHP